MITTITDVVNTIQKSVYLPSVYSLDLLLGTADHQWKTITSALWTRSHKESMDKLQHIGEDKR